MRAAGGECFRTGDGFAVDGAARSATAIGLLDSGQDARSSRVRERLARRAGMGAGSRFPTAGVWRAFRGRNADYFCYRVRLQLAPPEIGGSAAGNDLPQ